MVIGRKVVHTPASVAAAASPVSPGVASCDWDALHAAVLARLRHFCTAPGLWVAPSGDLAVRDGVAECVAALEQLQLTMAHELMLRHEIEARAFELARALQQAHQELAEWRAAGHHPCHHARDHARHHAVYEDSGHGVGRAALSRVAKD